MFNWFEQRRARERQMFDFMAGTHNNIHAIRRAIERLDREKRGERLGAVLEERESGGYVGMSNLIHTEPVQYHTHANLEKRLKALEQALWPTTVTTPNTDVKQE